MHVARFTKRRVVSIFLPEKVSHKYVIVLLVGSDGHEVC